MNPTFDTRILLLGLLVVCGLLARGLETGGTAAEITGSIPALADTAR